MATVGLRIVIDTGSGEPLYRQIVRQVRAMITTGKLADGDRLSSIRGLARQLEVSVITVQRAYEEMQREGLAMARRGRGAVRDQAGAHEAPEAGPEAAGGRPRTIAE